MGLAVLPSRLKKELALLKDAMLSGADISKDETLSKHAEWAAEILRNHPDFGASNAEEILKQETGIVFSHVLEDAGVYKRTLDGKAAFMRFVKTL